MHPQYGEFPPASLQTTVELEITFQCFKPDLITAINDIILSIAIKCQAHGLIKETYQVNMMTLS